MERKTVQFKASVDAVQGIITGYGAVTGNVDLGNDRIIAGAFRKTIAERLPKIKLCWNHNLDDAWGRITQLVEVPKAALPSEVLTAAPDATGGLFMEAKVSLTPTGLERLQLVADGVVDGLSIGYDVVDHGYASEGAKRVRELRQLKLYEISNVTLGMNEGALVSGVKSRDGRTRLTKAAGETFTYTMQRLYDALSDAYGTDAALYNPYACPMLATGDGPGCTIQDVYSDAVVVSDKDYDAYWEIPYSIADNGTVTLGQPQLVKLTYSPVPAGGPEDMGQMAHPGAAEHKADVSTAAWDGPAEVAKADVSDLRAMCAVVDGDGSTKSDYHLPHHMAADGHPLNRAGLIAAGNSLMGSRGGYQGPDAGKAKTHLQAHYHALDLKAPWESDDSKKAFPISASGTHGAFDGEHSHAHAANGAQGDDATHEHQHSHAGDGDHGHAHGKAAEAPLAVKVGRRNSSSDEAHLVAMHSAMHDAHAHLMSALGGECDLSDGDDEEEPVDDGTKTAMLRLSMTRLAAVTGA